MAHTVKILKVEPVTHDVRRFTVEKPEGFRFEPGQATLVSINQPEWQKEKRPFTFTSLNEWPDLEFTIKIYPDHDGVTSQLGKLRAGDELVIRKPWGTIQYKGPGWFIAGGAGVTPSRRRTPPRRSSWRRPRTSCAPRSTGSSGSRRCWPTASSAR